MGATQTKETVTTRLSERQATAWHLLENDPTAEEVFFGGSAGPGKSFLGCLWKMYRRIRHPETRGLIGRNEYVDLRDSTLQTFLRTWNDYGRFNPLGITGSFNGQDRVFRFSNGSVEYFRHLSYDPSDPDFHRLGSTEYTDVFVDEMPECSERAIDIVGSRIRYRLIGGVPKFLGAGNPANNWTKWRYIKDEEGRPSILKDYQRFVSALLSDNPDPEFRRIYQKQLEKLPFYDRQRLLYGDWDAVPRTGGEAFYTFDPERHVQDVWFLPELPVMHLSFDQNVKPYLTLLAAQCRYDEAGALEIRVVREYCLKHPRATTQAACEAFLSEFGTRVQGVYIYGDASGNKRDTRAARSDYDIAEATLKAKVNGNSRRVQSYNPEVRKRVLFLCAIFEGKMPRASIVIDRSCHNLIQDLSYIKQDANGGKLKELTTENGVRFEKYGHTSDAFEYLLTTILKTEFQNFERLIQ
jgi:phage terminase large subunit